MQSFGVGNATKAREFKSDSSWQAGVEVGRSPQFSRTKNSAFNSLTGNIADEEDTHVDTPIFTNNQRIYFTSLGG